MRNIFTTVSNSGIWFYIAIAITIILGAIRVDGNKTQLFQAIAHCFTFWMFGYGTGSKKWEYVILATGVSILELLCFLGIL